MKLKRKWALIAFITAKGHIRHDRLRAARLARRHG
jgi:hypothetical protein